MNIVAFIFARGGSKGLPGKNIRSFGGKPLIAWSIECALSSKRIQRVIVSTDSTEIAGIAKEYGAEVPFIRPSELATDQSSEWLSWQHALNYLKSSTGELPDAIISLPTTSPLRNLDDVENCLDEFLQGGCDLLITVTEAGRNPYFNMVKENGDGTVSLVLDSVPVTRRQDAPVVYDMATVCYVANPTFVLSNKSIFDGRVRAFRVPKERAVDIDTLLDFQVAEFLLNHRKGI
jgi:CMP-N-acetylneuraminic acid synthetase